MTLHSGHGAALRRTARRLAAGLVSAPLLDVADDSGLLGALVNLDLEAVIGVRLSAWAWLVFFSGLGAAFAGLFVRHRPGGRRVFTLAALVPLAAYWIGAGLRLSTVVSMLLLALGYVSWRIAGDGDPSVDG